MSKNATLKKPVVLVVDDNRSICALLTAMLRDDGYTVAGEVGHGSIVLDAVEKAKPGIVCLDYDLPGVDGLTLLKELHAKYPETAVVMITGSEDPDLRHQATEAGAAGFIHKPFSQRQALAELGHVAHALHLLKKYALAQHLDQAKSRGRAVVADDSESMRRLLCAILKESGVEVVAQAHDGFEALKMTLLHRPDLVCLDINMPVMNGLDALVEIHKAAPGIKVMMVTSHSERENVQKAGQSGAMGYILKPYQPEMVAKAIDKMMH